METAGIGIQDSIPFHVMFENTMAISTKEVQIRQMLKKLLMKERTEVETRLSRQVEEEEEAHQDHLRAQLSVMFSNVLFYIYYK